MKKTLLIPLIFIISQMSLFSQLSGSYTVGQPGDDFSTIDTALTVLFNQGMTGSVEFLLSNGNYGFLSIYSFIPQNNDTFIIRSKQGNPDSVVFYGCHITDSKNIIIKDIAIYKQSSNGYSLVYVDEVYNVRFTGCRIIDDITTNYNTDEATFRIDHAWTGNITSVYIDSCYISGLSGIYPYIFNEYTISERGDNGRSYFTGDTIIGGWNVFNAYYRYFNGCVLKLERLDEVGNKIFNDCIIEFYPGSGYSRLNTNHMINCEVFGVYELDFKSSKTEFSTFHLPVRMVHTHYAYLEGNIFEQELRITFGYNMKYYKNVFLSDIHFSFPDGAFAQNNFFADTVDVIHGGLRLYHNNFGDSSLLIYCSGGELVNNNIYSYTGYHNFSTFRNNNFASDDIQTFTCSCFDPSPSYYDPQYTSPKDLHINNPALFSRAQYVSHVIDDIDYEIRDDFRSIGADETCLTIPLPDTIFIECGTGYILKTCRLDSTTASLKWKPGSSLIDSIAYNPVVIVNNASLIWLEDSLGNIIDSTYLIPTQIKHFGRRIFNGYCGVPIYLSTYVPKGSSISWSPDTLVDYPDSSIVEVTTCESIQFIVTIDNGPCGTINDTIDLVIDPEPNAYFTWDSIDCMDAYLSMYYPCYDSVLWDFDDGTFSTHTSGWHSFPGNGTYMVTLTVWHKGFSDYYTKSISINCIGIAEHSNQKIIIFPNPAHDKVKISLEPGTTIKELNVYNDLGQNILQSNQQENVLDVSKLPRGYYVIEVISKEFIYREKLILQ